MKKFTSESEKSLNTVNAEEKNCQIIDYLFRVAEFKGRKGDTNDQAAYSLSWFYDEVKKGNIELNNLVKMFLFGSKPTEYENLINAVNFEYNVNCNTPNAEQAQAIEMVLKNRISFIIGPPGTGKTETILNIMANILESGMNGAVVAGNNEAINNIKDKIMQFDESDLLKNKMKNSFMPLGNSDIRKRAKNSIGESLGFKSATKEDNKHGIAGCEECIQAEEFLSKYPLITSTIHSLPKCFENGYKYQYDYIIIDEASQVGILEGIVAMNYAKHLILVGDDNQLPPVFITAKKGKLESLRDNLDIPERIRMDQENLSLLTSCNDVFSDMDNHNKNTIMLTKHYRCHAEIIGFVNKYVYEGKLEIMTPKVVEDSYPIKVIWYRGDYREKRYSDKTESTTSCCNMKQVQIFVKEEWENLKNRPDFMDLSIAILSPYRSQLAAIEEALISSKIDEVEIEPLYNDDDSNSNFENNCLPSMLTIHKSQGKEFDIVYLLPVDDGQWEWPWSQKRRLVNVAVTRAKKELRIITSTKLMSDNLQKELTGMVTPRDSKSGKKAKKKNDDDGLFVQKLTDYTLERIKNIYVQQDEKENLLCKGFHESSLISIFDNIPHFQNPIDHREIRKLSAPELSFIHALEIMDIEGLEIAIEVPFKDIMKDGEPITDNEFWLNRHFDFVIFCKETRVILMVVEVDGEYHRFDENTLRLNKTMEKDNEKDEFIKELGGHPLNIMDSKTWDDRNSSFTFLRLPSNGTTYWETDEICQKVKKIGGIINPGHKTIDTLLKERLNSKNESPIIVKSAVKSYEMMSRSLTKAIKSFEKPNSVEKLLWESKSNEELNTQKANLKLEKLGYLQKVGNSWAPTDKGFEMGITTRSRLNKDMTIFTIPVYSLKARRFLAEKIWGKVNKNSLGGISA